MNLFHKATLTFISIVALISITPARMQVWAYDDEKISPAFLSSGMKNTQPTIRADLDLDGEEECLEVMEGEARLSGSGCDEDEIEWSSPLDWEVMQALVTDLNRDGKLEVALLIWRDFKPWPIDSYIPNPRRIDDFHDKDNRSCHLVLIGWRGGEYREVWAGSALADPLREIAAADLDGDGKQELVALESKYDDPAVKPAHALTVWEWNGFGFTLLARTRGRFRQLVILITKEGTTRIFTVQ